MSNHINGLLKYYLYKQAQIMPQPFSPSFTTPHIGYFPYHPAFTILPAQYSYPASLPEQKKEGIGSKILNFAKGFAKTAIPLAVAAYAGAQFGRLAEQKGGWMAGFKDIMREFGIKMGE
jgi:hypothetical protein